MHAQGLIDQGGYTQARKNTRTDLLTNSVKNLFDWELT